MIGIRDDDDDDDSQRREEEWQALISFYGTDDVVVRVNDNVWRINIGPYDSTLEVWLPKNYPSGSLPIPTFQIQPWVLDDKRVNQLRNELLNDSEAGMEVILTWAETCRAILEDESTMTTPIPANNNNEETSVANTDDPSLSNTNQEQVNSQGSEGADFCSFIPPTSKYHQPIRKFQTDIIDNELYKRTIHKGSLFHPPKSGPSEQMLAHVASVESMEHVQWVLAHLLFHDKKVGAATHNMFAYKFMNGTTIVSDNDDDGEKGSGAKLASLLDISGADGVIVVVSRWYGGVKLGPARFKWIANVARDALVQHGFIT